ncbi:hypothetical protein R5R35_012694 [Gryllus longicercus]|uniref:Uncharacterized protein n=1 Tax=Gryllus longicercus TaxID=2509291 RepID=A0AAN9YYU4_9ORTH
MADFLKELKDHATSFHKDIKHLERAFSSPWTFYGTVSRSAEANVFLKKELKCITNMHSCIGEQIQEMEDRISDTNQLLQQVESASEDLNSITKLLEACGFTFSEEKEISGCNEENQRIDIAKGNDENVYEREQSEDPGEEYVLSYVAGNEKCEEFLESTEKYLVDNNIDLDDIVTPYFQRNSLYCGKKT